MISVVSPEHPSQGPAKPINKLFDQIQSKGYYGFYPSEIWAPPVNVYETEAAYLVCVDLAGVEKDKIDIEVHEGRLTLRGKRQVPSCAEQSSGDARVRIHLMEIDHGVFARDVELPDNVQQDRITAKYIDGMLWIELPIKH